MKYTVLSSATAALLLLGSAGAYAQVTPGLGDLAVTEIMFNPGPDACVTDANGEYFEIMNISENALDLTGVYFSDSTGVAGEYFQIPASALPVLYPGQMFIFVRRGDLLLNGGVAWNYEYTVTTGNPVPPDKSKASSTAMQFSNSATSIDGPRIFSALGGAPGSGSEILIEQATYTSGAAPFNISGSSGTACKRLDPFQPMLATTGPLTNSSNAGQCAGLLFGPCNQKGTPGQRNNLDVTVNWPMNIPFDSVNFPNAGILSCAAPVSVGATTVSFRVNGGAALAGSIYTFGFSDAVASEIPMFLLLAGSPGSLLLDLPTIGFVDDPSFTFDGNGFGNAIITVPNNPIIIGLDFNTQFLGVDFVNFLVVGSNGLTVRIRV